MFGISLTELTVIAAITLVVVGPQKLPGMLRTVGEYVRKLRRITTEVRQQTGIDDILRQEGIHGGLSELRGMLRGDLGITPARRALAPARREDPYPERVPIDKTREHPPEGPDAYGALPDDLVDDDAEVDATSEAPAPEPLAVSSEVAPSPATEAEPPPSATLPAPPPAPGQAMPTPPAPSSASPASTSPPRPSGAPPRPSSAPAAAGNRPPRPSAPPRPPLRPGAPPRPSAAPPGVPPPPVRPPPPPPPRAGGAPPRAEPAPTKKVS